MPLVVALVGIGGTVLITQQQGYYARLQAHAEMEAARERAEADRQIKILEIFSEKFSSENEAERALGVRLLSTIDSGFAERVALAVEAGEEENSNLKRVAVDVAREAAETLASADVCTSMFSVGRKYRTWHEGGGLQFAGDIVFDEIRECGPSGKRCFTARMTFENYDPGFNDAVGSWDKNYFRLFRTVERDGPTSQLWEGRCMEDRVEGNQGHVAIKIYYR